MIFVTVGTQLPFDRMIRTIDEWATTSGRKVFAQIGPAAYRPRHIEFNEFLDAQECRIRVEQARIVIAHAGMGSILTALELGKPIIVMPRQARFGEHRNDHQVATARQLLAQGRVIVAFDEAHLLEKLQTIDNLCGATRISTQASPKLLSTLRNFIDRVTAGQTLGITEDEDARTAPAHPSLHELASPEGANGLRLTESSVG
jgi:UDP-N-acetylglucosamine transferase subunit ALG13